MCIRDRLRLDLFSQFVQLRFINRTAPIVVCGGATTVDTVSVVVRNGTGMLQVVTGKATVAKALTPVELKNLTV